MTWSDVYLICFAIGFLFSLLSFIAGGLNMHGYWPHAHGLHFHHAAGDAPANGHAAGPAHSVSPFNFFTIAVFLAWFGGTGYLLSRYSTIVFALGLLISTAVGLVGASIVFVFLAKVLMAPEALMDPADYEMVGVIGRVSSPIRESGTGEIIYSQAGSRRACPARSEDGAAIARDAEVVVTRYEKGIAYGTSAEAPNPQACWIKWKRDGGGDAANYIGVSGKFREIWAPEQARAVFERDGRCGSVERTGSAD